MKLPKNLDMDKVNKLFEEHFDVDKAELEKGITMWTLTPQRFRCETCRNEGYVHTTNEQGFDEIQRCDECAVFSNDLEAQQYVEGLQND